MNYGDKTTSASSIAPKWLSYPKDVNALYPDIWPSSARRTPNGTLAIDGIPANRLAASFGTPLYVVAEEDARARAQIIHNAVSDLSEKHG